MSNTLARGIAPVTAALVLALAGCQPKSGAGSEETPDTATAAAAVAPIAALDTGRLQMRAADAVATQRFHSPAGDNAVEYYLALRDKAPDDLVATTALVELQPYLVIAGEQALMRADAAEAARLLALLERMDAHAPALPRLREALAQLQDRGAASAAEAGDANRPLQARPTEAAVNGARPPNASEPVAATAGPDSNGPAAADRSGASEPDQAIATSGSPIDVTDAAASGQRPRGADRRTAAAEAPRARPLPRLVHDEAPRYPAAARNRRLEGRVEVAFTIQPDGRVSNVRVLGAQPSGVFDRAAVAAASRWRFEPAGQPISTTRELTFRLPKS